MKGNNNAGNLLKLGATVALLLAAGLARHAGATIVSVTPAADTALSSALPNKNYGGEVAVEAGNVGPGYDDVKRDLLQFDLSSIPAGAIIQSATLRLAFTGNNKTLSTTLSLYRMTTEWIEGTGGNPASVGATWLKPDASQSATWNAQGAAADHLPTSSSSLTSMFLGSNSTRVDFSFAGLGTDVQYWHSNPGLNNGWILRNSDEVTRRDISPWPDKQWWTRESSFTPFLDVEYELVPEPASFGLIVVGLGIVWIRRSLK